MARTKKIVVQIRDCPKLKTTFDKRKMHKVIRQHFKKHKKEFEEMALKELKCRRGAGRKKEKR